MHGKIFLFAILIQCHLFFEISDLFFWMKKPKEEVKLKIQPTLDKIKKI